MPLFSTKSNHLFFRWGFAVLSVVVYVLVLTLTAHRQQAERDQQTIQSLEQLLQNERSKSREALTNKKDVETENEVAVKVNAEEDKANEEALAVYEQADQEDKIGEGGKERKEKAGEQSEVLEGGEEKEADSKEEKENREEGAKEEAEKEESSKEGGSNEGEKMEEGEGKGEETGNEVWSERKFLAISNYTDAAAKYGAEHPHEVAEIVRAWMTEGRDMHKLQTPVHRVLDYIMVRDCDVKKGGKKGCIDGFVLPEQADKYYSWSAAWVPPVEEPTLCETGFNAGHSAATFLLSNRNLRMVSFDLFIQAYSGSCLEYIKAVFGDDRMTLHKGDSHASLTKQAAKKKLKCDVVSVDGAHSFKACMKDVEGLGQLLARPKTPVLMDDTADGFEMKGGPAEVWRKLVKEEKLKQTKCVSLGIVKQWKRGSKPKPRGFCIGELNPGLQKFEDE
eukprot:TRINITY_DN785_c0_g1_i1.p1 TRINITY_DN785_c0_g1~~TRINITY_DN785_c0_g1_i1.p1  ORF type:complete len:449 (+),score=133.57 TRINITY_DN785_c0_g1_i1:2150-3496(+)